MVFGLAQKTDKYWCMLDLRGKWVQCDDYEGKLVESSSPRLTPDHQTPLYHTTIKGVTATLNMIQNPAELSEMEYWAIGGPNNSTTVLVNIARGQVRDFTGLELESYDYEDYVISGKW